MIKTLKNLIMTSLLAGFLVAPVVLAPVTVLAADIGGSLCEGGNLEIGNSNCDEGNPENKVNEMITLVINFFSIVVGVVAVIMIIIGGLKYITSSGDSNNITSAKNTILYAIVGLIIVALAQFIVKFVLAKATG